MKIKLGEVCKFYSGTGFPVAYQGKNEDELPFYKVGDIANNVVKGNDYLLVCNNYISKQEAEQIRGTIIPKNTVVFAKIGEALKLNRRVITSCDCLIDNNVMGIAPKENILRIKYFFYFMKWLKLQEYAESTTVPSVRKSRLEQVEMEIPSLNIQKEIEQILDRCVILIRLYQKQLQELNDLIRARFVEMFGDVIHNDRKWEYKQFSDITTSRLGKMLDAKHQTGICKYPYLANFNVQWFRFELDNLNEMDFNEKDREEFCLEDGDLLVCEGGEIGRCAVWHNQVRNCFFQKALHRVRCNQNIILPDYLSWWFKYNCENGGFAAIEGAKATISHLTGAKMKMLDVTVPPIGLQEQFVDFINQVNKSKAVVQESLEETQLLFDSLMQKYFG